MEKRHSMAVARKTLDAMRKYRVHSLFLNAELLLLYHLIVQQYTRKCVFACNSISAVRSVYTAHPSLWFILLVLGL